MDLWTVIIIACAVAVVVYLMYRYLPESPAKQIAMWVVIAFVVLFLAVRFLKPILSGIRL
jgi:uncharacterized membrane protein